MPRRIRITPPGEAAEEQKQYWETINTVKLQTCYDIHRAFKIATLLATRAWLRPVSRGNRNFTVDCGRLRQSAGRSRLSSAGRSADLEVNAGQLSCSSKRMRRHFVVTTGSPAARPLFSRELSGDFSSFRWVFWLGERRYRTLLPARIVATMSRVVNYHSSWARQQWVELFDASGNPGSTAGRGFNPTGGAPGGG
ncbi:hypothetical protein F511_09413 [Dorcoceras hygrometricum]|uniref:Uncharacterized protein n=1 Tax=Dorcoceras hygrometricum TaxID=472368 RepID=A0A2Z7BCS5_9LAMI|nr:hypothetical protein F511_09413 [Dorcoceras hygrometricum]